jgi:hypothetical protein
MHIVVVDGRKLPTHLPPFGFATAICMVESQYITIPITIDNALPSPESAGDYVPLDLQAPATVSPLSGLASLSECRISPISLEVVMLPA